MAQATINVRIEEETKKQFENFCAEVGLNVSTAINMFIKKVVRENEIPFKISIDPFYSQNNIKYLEGVVKDIETGKAKIQEHELIEEE